MIFIKKLRLFAAVSPPFFKIYHKSGIATDLKTPYF